MVVKKIKISSVKRAAHLKRKKTPVSKQHIQKLAQQKAAKEKGQHIFVQNKHRNNFIGKKKRFKYGAQVCQSGHDRMSAPTYEEDDEEILNTVADMLEDDDLELLQARQSQKKLRKRKKNTDEEYDDNQNAVCLEREYNNETIKELVNKKFKINLLPIKNRDGEIITRSTEVDYLPNNNTSKTIESDDVLNNVESCSEMEYMDSDDDIVNDNTNKETESIKLISNTDLLIARQQEFERQKYRIGIICSGILEKPEDKMRNFPALFELMDENLSTGSSNLLAVRKLAIISITEVFKDILPEYCVGQVDTKVQHVRKSTLERVTYENALLNHFKKFLQRLEKLTAIVNRRSRCHIIPQAVKLAEVAVQCLCELLTSHMYFNYVKNIAQLLVFMLNCNYTIMRLKVYNCFRSVFTTDKKLDMTLFIVRRINNLIKMKNNNVHIECITCLLALKIKNVNLEKEKESELKQKKLEAHRQRLYNLSKKERKRRKKLAIVNKELEEARAEENKQSKQQKLTEIVKMVFTIYFRVLKHDPSSKLLSVVLEGLAEFAHIINLDFFCDLIDVLNNILEQEDLGYREQLHCIQTIFIILSGQGEVLNIDPIRFYQHFYRNLMTINAGKNHNDFMIILKTLNEVLVKRKHNMSQQRLLAFVKRLLTISLQLLHHGTLATLGTVKSTFQLTSILDILLDTDCSFGSGKYDPELTDPEYCNASCTALYEIALLSRHYHSIVRKMAMYIASNVPATGKNSLPTEIGKLTPYELFEQYDSTQMEFNPPIPLPQPTLPKLKKLVGQTLQDQLFEKAQKQILKKKSENLQRKHEHKLIDFYKEILKK